MDQPDTPFESLVAAVTRAGSQAALARICGVSQPAVWKWLQSSKRLPAEQVLVVERETGVPRHLLRPDIYPADLSGPTPFHGHVDGIDDGAAVVSCDRRAASHRSDAA